MDLCLAATLLFLWFLLDCFQVQLGASRQELHLATEVAQWQPHWPVFPWLLGVAGLFLVFARQRRGRLSAPQAQQQCLRLRQVLLLAAGLLGLRLLSLWNPLCYLFPYLTLLWSPHATWALSASFLLFPQLDTLPSLPSLSTRAIALALFAGGALVYSTYTFYFCQLTMLHGDEGQYLRVTQSLLHDGDMDLADNLDQTDEFHVSSFGVHTAPASPPGKVYSIHPIGLSALLLPAYWAGLHWWGNPRLGCALFMALIAAGCVALAFVWLVRLGRSRPLALACTLLIASTPPFFYYCNQLYPELPALLILLAALTLLVHWQLPGAGYRSLGKWEPALLGGLTALLVALLFLHPRYLPLAALLGSGVALQVWGSPRRQIALRAVGIVAGTGVLALLIFNYTFSGDPFGPFLPGNAWDKGALQPSTWLVSLPGHWLHNATGLLNVAPFFLACLFGLTTLARQPDPQRWLALGLYAATAGINGLHPDWTFGFCLPARFLLTALPVLLWGLSLALELIAVRAVALFLFLFGLTIGWDSLWGVIALPENGYGSLFLSQRTLTHYYPWNLHFFAQTNAPFPWSELLFWLLLSTTLYCALVPLLQPRLRRLASLVAALLPFLWGQVGRPAGRLSSSLSPYIVNLSPEGLPDGDAIVFDSSPSEKYRTTTGQGQEDGRFAARSPQDQAGILMSYYTTALIPGIHRFHLADATIAHSPGQVAGHLVITQRPTVPAVADWGVYHSQPLQLKDDQVATELFFQADNAALGYAYVEFSGAGQLFFQNVQHRFFAIPLNCPLSQVRHYPIAFDPSSRGLMGARYQNLEAGQYRVCFELSGTAFAAFFPRQSTPVYMAVYVAQDTTAAAQARVEAQAARWFLSANSLLSGELRPEFVRPQVESIQPPWWTAVPFLGRNAYAVDFGLSAAREVRFLMHYEGEEGLHLTGITLYRKLLPFTLE